MKLEVVTTFSQAGYRCYGRRFLDSLLNHDQYINVAAYHENQPPVSAVGYLLSWRNLDDDPERRAFLDRNAKDPARVGTELDFNSQSIRFCHKVFAVTDAAFRSKAEWLVWIDADVLVHDRPDWCSLLPKDKSLVYLGRDPVKHENWVINKVWRPICSETGFVAYRLTDGRVLEMLQQMRRYYTTDLIYTRPSTDWHDAKVFDLCREQFVPPDRWHNLSAGVPGTDVWPSTVLAKWSTHQKGPRRKHMVYGGVVK